MSGRWGCREIAQARPLAAYWARQGSCRLTKQAARPSKTTRPARTARRPDALQTAAPGRVGVVILAAGQGTRMRSSLPKVLHRICGTPMVTHVVRAAAALSPRRIVVTVGHGGEAVREALATERVAFVEQPERLGTGDAVRCARSALAGCDPILVLNGDGPLVRTASLSQLVEATASAAMAMLTCAVDDAGKLGRLVRDSRKRPKAVVEAPEYRGGEGPAEVNTGPYAFRAHWLWGRMDSLLRSSSGEYYITSLVAAAADDGCHAATIPISPEDGLGVDDRIRLAEAEATMRRRVLERLMGEGVTITDPATTYADADVVVGEDVVIHPGCHLLGTTVVGARCLIGPGTLLRNATLLDDVRVQSSVVEDSRIAARTRVGPYAHVRGGASIGEDCELGNYSEVKNSVFGNRVKMHHFSYVGDADVGDEANIAAGVITCNFDGVQKYRTVIGKRAFVGSDTLLVAPVRMGDDAMTGAGTVVNRDLPDGARAVGAPARLLPDAPGAKPKRQES